MIGKVHWCGIIYHGMLRTFAKNKHNFKAFTMAEAILVMTILGIIATVMITTLKPATYKEQALKILADKVLGEIDTATSQILLNDSIDGTMDHLLTADTRKEFNISSADLNPSLELVKLYKKYLVIKRGSQGDILILKDGAVFGVYLKPDASLPSIYPGETQAVDIPMPHGHLTIRINGIENSQNILGKDVFRIPFGKYGLDYDPKPAPSPPPPSGP